MICEFALEPSLLSNWRDFRFFVDHFGISHGRLISRYPKRWKRLVYESLAGCGDIERKKIEERLSTIDDRIYKRQNCTWTDGQQWLANAEAEHQRLPFHAIIAATHPNGPAYVLDGNTLDETNKIWCVDDQEVVERNAVAMAKSISAMLQLSHEIILVDPHFDPQRQGFRNPLREFLAAALQGRTAAVITKVEIHTSEDDDKPSTQLFHDRCRQSLPQLIPTGMSVHIYRWKEIDGGDEFHNRYVLTDIGGVKFNTGLDEGDPGQTDDVSLLKPDAYALRRAQYAAGSTAFTLVDQIEIAGSKA
jgi:hypothetical protein